MRPLVPDAEELSRYMEITRRFMAALIALEREWNVDDIVSLFNEHCDIGNVVSPNVFVGRDGAREFWTTYRAWFGEVESSFHKVIDNDNHSAIEWSSRGTSATGQLVTYEGVSILEFENGRISRFRAYFNPECLSRKAKSAHPVGDVFLSAFPPT
jgi:hypothetical protein